MARWVEEKPDPRMETAWVSAVLALGVLAPAESVFVAMVSAESAASRALVPAESVALKARA